MNVAAASQSALILFREGLEAMLVLTALAAYLVRIEAREGVKALYIGAGAAVLASLVVAWIFQMFLGGTHNDLVEGFVLAGTAGLLLYVSGWLFGRADAARWQSYISAQAKAAAGAGSLTTLGVVAFLAVFREGAETVLFLHGIAAQTGGWSMSMVAGLAFGAGSLVVLFVLLKGLAVRLPLKPFFLFTAALLCLMALLFAGQALQEFQELGWLPVTGVSLPAWLIGLGANPSVEALLLQGALFAALVAVLAVNKGRSARAAERAPAAGD